MSLHKLHIQAELLFLSCYVNRLQSSEWCRDYRGIFVAILGNEFIFIFYFNYLYFALINRKWANILMIDSLTWGILKYFNLVFYSLTMLLNFGMYRKIVTQLLDSFSDNVSSLKPAGLREWRDLRQKGSELNTPSLYLKRKTDERTRYLRHLLRLIVAVRTHHHSLI